jgi:hypothetical protein
MSSSSLLTIAAAVGILCTGCAQPFQVVKLPLRNADLFPLHHQVGAYAVAVDEISDPERAQMFFGVDLIERGIVPVNVTVSNNGVERLLVKPSDIMLRRGTAVVDPLPIEFVYELAHDSRRMNRETREVVAAYFRQIAFTETVLAPGDSYHGVLFFRGVSGEGDRFERTMFRAMSLYHQGATRLEVAVTVLDDGERIRFGPFPVTSSDPVGAF